MDSPTTGKATDSTPVSLITNGQQRSGTTSSNSNSVIPNDHRSLLAESPKRSNSGSNASPKRPERSASTSSASGLNPRSCVTCRRRKVRCNKENPCSNCVRANIECIFPGPGRAPRRARKPPDAELLARLKRLEGVVTSLGVDVGSDGVVRDKTTASPTQTGRDSEVRDREARLDSEKRHSIDKHLGRLVINEDRSRYVSNQFWASMGDEIAEMRDLLDAPSSDDEDVLQVDDYNSPAQDRFASHQGFIFGYSSLKVDLKSLHPSPSQIFILWEVYKENVDPVVKLIHRPTTRNILLNAASSTDKISRPAEALLFSIYFGAVTSLSQEQCRKLLDEDRNELVRKYRFATEQALARADFLNSSSLVCLQAFVAFLVFVRNMDDSRMVWALGGLAIHIAQALGIHRDGTHFGLPPFDVEMRRRLWWHISVLDNRSSEDHGTDPTFSEQFYDTKLPLNVNDEDIWPGMVEPPVERPGATEMTFCLIRFELSVFNRRLNITNPGAGDLRTRPEGSCPATRDQTLQEKEDMIDRCHRHIEEKYLRHCDMATPILWVSATVARLILAKMWLMVHHPRSYFNDGDAPPVEVKDRLFITSIEVIEFSYLLERNENTAKWGWLFRSYMQWQSVAFVLSEICTRSSWTQEVERGWRAVESVYNVRFIQPDVNHRGMLWKPMKTLWRKAQLARQRYLRTQQGQKGIPAAGQTTQHGELGSGRWDGSSARNGQQSESPTTTEMDLNNSNSMADNWASGWMNNQDTIMGASGAAFGLDLSTMLTPESQHSGSSGAAAAAGPSRNMAAQNLTHANSVLPNAGTIPPPPAVPAGMDAFDGSMSAGFGQPQSQSQQQKQKQTLPNLTNSASANVNANIQSGTTSPDLNMDLMDPNLTATNNNNSWEPGSAEMMMSQDFFNWSGWNPGVGDFTVGGGMGGIGGMAGGLDVSAMMMMDGDDGEGGFGIGKRPGWGEQEWF